MIYKSKRQSAESKAKSKFRQTGKWKKFRAFIKKARKVDFVTQKPLLKGWQLHHANMQIGMYDNLNPDNFYALNKTTHELVHFLYRYTDWRELLERIRTILEKMEQLNSR